MMKALIIILLVVALFAPATQVAALHSSQHDPSQSLTMIPYSIDAFRFQISQGTSIELNVTSTSSVGVYFLNSSQYKSFNGIEIRGAIFSATGKIVNSIVGPLSAGPYYLIIDNNITGTAALVNFSYSFLPVYVYGSHSSLPAPVGIADYGVLNSSGYLYPYRVVYSRIDGYAEIYSIEAYNSTPPKGISPYGADLQMNSVLQVVTGEGVQDYLVQNTANFITNTDVISYVDNVWNLTGPISQLSTVSGRGKVMQFGGSEVYTYSTLYNLFSLPLHLHLVTAVSRSEAGIDVGLGYVSSGEIHWYDNVTMPENGSAHFLVSGYSTTPQGEFYDAELVFGGQGSGEVTNFNEINSTLFMTYTMENGTVTVPRMLYGFGSNTGEMADNMESYMANGKVYVTQGRGNFRPLGSPLSALYTVKFTESGLPNGTEWSVSLQGITERSFNNTILFKGIVPGQHSYSVQSGNSNYTPYNSTGSLYASGATSVPVRFQGKALAISGITPAIAIAVAVVVVAAAGIIAWRHGRKAKGSPITFSLMHREI